MMLSAFIAVLSSSLACRLLSSGPLASLAIDHPNERSLHHHAVPRSGGLGILLGVVLGFGLDLREASLLYVALCLGGVSFIDDRRGLPVVVRLGAQFASAAVAINLDARWSGLWVPLALLYCVWMTNLYNFMDGADGLAGGMAVIGFTAYAAGSMGGPGIHISRLCVCVAAAAAGFLLCNFPPARIFMGDVGSTALGFLAATVGLQGYTVQCWPLWFPVLVFLPFIGDASVTLLRRALHGERLWQAHREHYYQRLVRSGWHQRRLISAAYLLIAGTAASAVTTLKCAPEMGWAVLVTWIAALGLLMRFVDMHWSRYQQNTTDFQKRTLTNSSHSRRAER